MSDDIEDEEGKVVVKGSERQKVECWSRVMGYLRPYSEYNIGKKREHRDRKLFEEPEKLPERVIKEYNK